jgi:hypothetical protein
MEVRSLRWVLAGVLSMMAARVAAAPASQGQARFELLGGGAIVHMPDVSVYTIRDRQTANCYALFIGNQAALGGALSAAAGRGPAKSPEDVPASKPAADNSRALTDRPNPQYWATIPWMTTTPGAQTGGWEYLAESVRLALVDPSTVKALSAPLRDALSDLDDRLRRLEALLQNIEASRSYAVWPVSCDAAQRK